MIILSLPFLDDFLRAKGEIVEHNGLSSPCSIISFLQALVPVMGVVFFSVLFDFPDGTRAMGFCISN